VHGVETREGIRSDPPKTSTMPASAYILSPDDGDGSLIVDASGFLKGSQHVSCWWPSLEIRRIDRFAMRARIPGTTGRAHEVEAETQQDRTQPRRILGATSPPLMASG
jgi:hypothetical protein